MINRCLHTKTTIGLVQSSHISAHLQIDPLLVHPLSHLYRSEAEHLFKLYREQISDIMYVYHFHSEVDLICKFDSQQQTISKQFDIADSAQLELQHLNDRIRSLFNGSQLKTDHPLKCSCDHCDEHRMARAAACYLVTYEQPYTKKILSFAWLFSSWLVKLRRKNLEKQHHGKCSVQRQRGHVYLVVFSLGNRVSSGHPSNFSLVGQAFLHSFFLLVENQSLRFMVDLRPAIDGKGCLLRLQDDPQARKSINIRVQLMQWAMLEVTTGWLDRQGIFATGKYSSRTSSRPTIFPKNWKHVATQFLFANYQPKTCSRLTLLQHRFLSKQTSTITNEKGAAGE